MYIFIKIYINQDRLITIPFCIFLLIKERKTPDYITTIDKFRILDMNSRSKIDSHLLKKIVKNLKS